MSLWAVVDHGAKIGVIGYTPLSSSLTDGKVGTISEDTVHLSIWCDWGHDADILFERLRRAQMESQGKAEEYVLEEMEGELPEGMDEEFAAFVGIQPESKPIELPDNYIEGHGNGYLEFGGCLWKVGASGIGGKEGRSYYRYVIRSGGVLIGFRRDKHETVANMWVEIGSIPLAANGGLTGVWAMLTAMFQKEGIRIEKDIVSRVDIYGDFDTCPVEEFCTRFNENKKISRARKVGHYGEDLNYATYFSGRRHTGFSVGTNIKLRVYDKRYELEKDPIKWGIFAEKYDGIPDVLTRVEFQLRRVALKEFLTGDLERIEGVDSYLKNREKLWKYLTEDWFRLTEDAIDKQNKHQSRAETWSVWQVVQNAVVAAKEIFRWKRAPKYDMEQLYRMAMGCICKIAAFEIGDAVEKV
ncbi:MAG: hypothetical protein LIQ31_01800 [Planctomycetes bacterium]|nr:hypothetical protein [Planctomycetota bacterium]